MPRPRSFDKGKVLDQVMTLFWTKGYGATSMMDIQKTTGLKPGSIYDSFGDKHGLFLEAVSHYRTNVVGKRLSKLLEPGGSRQKIEEFFEGIIEFSLSKKTKMGCLMSNSAMELAQKDDAIREIVQENLGDLAQAFCDVVRRGQAAGDIKSHEAPEDIARFLTATLQGLQVMSKSSVGKDTLQTTVRLALKVLD